MIKASKDRVVLLDLIQFPLFILNSMSVYFKLGMIIATPYAMAGVLGFILGFRDDKLCGFTMMIGFVGMVCLPFVDDQWKAYKNGS